MQITLTLSSIIALFTVMVVLALVPGVSVLTVSARSATSGFIHGAFTTAGIVVGDIFFILLVIFGLKFLAGAMDDMFVIIMYSGGAYLIWLGINFRGNKTKTADSERTAGESLQSSFMAGLLITLADQKAIVFYLGLFPAFLDLAEMSAIDAIIIVLIAILAVGGVKLGYAYAADKSSLMFGSRTVKAIEFIAACILVTVGVFLIAKASLALTGN